MTVLALRDDQNEWDAQQLAALRGTGIDEDVTEAELMVFLHECQRRKLDPFTRQIYLLGRYDRRKKRKVYRSQTGIDGFRVVARRAADEARQTIEYEETLWCGPDRKWTDVWLDSEPPAACKIVVLRDGKRFPAIAKFSSYVQVNDEGRALGLWQKMADNQLAKCTEALALRKAFPEDLGGLYTEDELAQADNPQTVQATAEIIRDEPAPGPAGSWADDAAGQAAALKSEHAAGKLWHQTNAKANAGDITAEDVEYIKELIKARVDDIRAKAYDTAMGLLPEDTPWRAKIEELADVTDVEQALAELGGLMDDGTVDSRLGARIRRAIVARSIAAGFPGAVEEAA